MDSEAGEFSLRTFWPYKTTNSLTSPPPPPTFPALERHVFQGKPRRLISEAFTARELDRGLSSAGCGKGNAPLAPGPGRVAGLDLVFLFPSAAALGEPGVGMSFQGGWIISHPCCPLWGEGGVLCSTLPGFAQKDRAEQVGRRTIYYLMFLSKHFVFACIEKLSIKYVHTSVHN